MRTFISARSGLPVALAVTLLLASGCGAGADSSGTDSTGGATAAERVTLTDGWVKATDTEMSSMFGELHNPGTEATTLVSAASPGAGIVEMHTFADDGTGSMVMTAVEEGFTIDAGGTLTMEPGGDHIMLMDLSVPLEPGEDIEIELTFADGSTSTVTVPAKEFSGAEPDYGHGDDAGHGDGHGDE